LCLSLALLLSARKRAVSERTFPYRNHFLAYRDTPNHLRVIDFGK
jgi:hypothetical protein